MHKMIKYTLYVREVEDILPEKYVDDFDAEEGGGDDDGYGEDDFEEDAAESPAAEEGAAAEGDAAKKPTGGKCQWEAELSPLPKPEEKPPPPEPKPPSPTEEELKEAEKQAKEKVSLPPVSPAVSLLFARRLATTTAQNAHNGGSPWRPPR